MKPPNNDIIPQGYKMTELGALPEEWEVVRLGEIFNVQQGKQLSEKESKEGKVKKSFLRTSNLNWGHIDISSIDEMYFTSEEFRKLKLESGDILVCEGGDVGRTALYRGELVECAYQNHLHRLRPKKDNLDAEYFVFWMNYAINQRKMYIHSANRTTIPNLSGSRLKEFIIPLPPLPEQQKIAAVLSAVQEAKEKTEAVIAATKALKKSMMKHLFTYGPVSPKEVENIQLKETEIGPVPEDWEVVRLGEIFSIFAGGDVSKINYSPIKIDKYIYPIYSNSKENNGLYGFSDTYNAQGNSITITARGNLGYAIPRYEKFNAIIRLLVLTPKNTLNIKFISEYINSKIKINLEGSSIPQLTVPKISMYMVPLPPLPIQQKIASILSAIDAKIEAEENKKKALEELFKSLLHNLMTAKIRVNKLGITS
ncbi:MAG TPA: restriction endonuclease subunit S [Acetivibrio sp.]|uniref:restriction endonuclease subunit S n=1 Tax=Acetivibrio sp. TaxID=1872092 RepID=UPI002BAB9D3E|nr:restriction endonuclease subunit S [Acetivibrio sp.]HOM03375.1 restriction endonuclease subunit S [Acetivibrio sp.]